MDIGYGRLHAAEEAQVNDIGLFIDSLLSIWSALIFGDGGQSSQKNYIQPAIMNLAHN